MSATTQPIGRRERNRRDKIQRILNTAKSLIENGGIEALTIQRLAQQLDCAVGALYRYFPSKDALLAELQCGVIRNVKDTLFDDIDSRISDEPLVQLVSVAKCYQTYLMNHPSHFRLISLGVSDPKQYLPTELGLKVMHEVQIILLRMSQIIEKAADTGVLGTGDAQPRTLVYWSAIQGVMQMNKLSRFSPDTLNNTQLLIETLRTLLLGWGATPQHVNDALVSSGYSL